MTASTKQKYGPRLSINSNSDQRKVYIAAVFQLALAAVIWGAAFTLVRWALEDFSASTLMFWRFFLAFVLAEAFHFIFFREDYRRSSSDRKYSWVAGLCLGSSLILQTHGLQFTTATNSSFITSLYVVIVPLVGALFFKQKMKLKHIVLGLSGFAGMALLLNIHQGGPLNWNVGDVLTLACAVMASFHIIYIGRASRLAKSAFRFNTYQNFWSLLLILPFLIFEMQQKQVPLWPEQIHLRSLVAVLVLAVFVSAFAFYLQVHAQKSLSNTTASLLCLLEAPNAFIFATLFLGEKINSVQTAGVILILLSSVFSVIVDRPQNRNHQDAGAR